MAHKKNILILDTGREWGGGTNSLIELLKRVDSGRYRFSALFYHNYPFGGSSDIKSELQKLGVDFILLPPERRGVCQKIIKEAGRAFLFFNRRLRKRFIFYVDYITRILPDSKRIEKILRERDIDLLYMNNQPSSNLEGILAAGALQIPVIQHARIEVDLNPLEADAVNSFVKKVICVSKGVMDALVRSGVDAGRCTVVHNGIDTESRPLRDRSVIREELDIDTGRPVVGTVCSLVRRKRVDLLLEAVARLNGEGYTLYCIVVGDGPEKEGLLKRADGLGISGRVRFTGFREDPLSYINAMDIFVLPSGKEGLPRVVLEAMLLKKPVVAFRVPGLGELVVDGETGLLVEDKGAAAVADAVKHLLDHRELLSSMGEAAAKRVMEDFSIKKYVKGVEAVFEEVLK